MSESTASNNGRKSAYVARNRAALLRSTQEVLALHGASATVELVADHAEIAVSTIYKHFPTKEALFESAFLAGMSEWETWAQSVISETADPLEKLVFPMRLLMKVPKTHPLFAQTVALNPEVFISAVPKMNFGLGPEILDLQNRKLIQVDDLDLRVKNLIMVFTLTYVDLCINPEMTEEKALAGVSVALEMLGLNQMQIEELMSAPLPELLATKS
jgi:AcrR family transcriptional regulator